MTEQESKKANSILLVIGGGIVGYTISNYFKGLSTGSDLALFVIAVFLIIGASSKQKEDDGNSNG